MKHGRLLSTCRSALRHGLDRPTRPTWTRSPSRPSRQMPRTNPRSQGMTEYWHPTGGGPLLR
jgi:hypothetical protein